MAVLYEGSKGTIIYVETGYDLSGATGMELVLSGPNGVVRNSTSVSVLAANITTSALGVLSGSKTVEYALNSGDLSMSTDRQTGTFKCYLIATLDSNTKLVSSTFRFKVSKPA